MGNGGVGQPLFNILNLLCSGHTENELFNSPLITFIGHFNHSLQNDGLHEWQPEIFLSPKHPHWIWDPTSLQSMGTVGLSSGVKWLRHDDDDHSPLSGAEVMEWGYTSTPPYAFRA
jgi:hypothetical protein